MAKLRIGVHQYWNQFAKTPLQDRITVDIDAIDGENELVVQGSKRREHLIAQVAITACVQDEPRHRYCAMMCDSHATTCRSSL